MFKFLLIFSIDIVTPIISSIQILCDAMCVQCFYIVYRKKYYYEKSFFCGPWPLLEEINAMFHIKIEFEINVYCN